MGTEKAILAATEQRMQDLQVRAQIGEATEQEARELEYLAALTQAWRGAPKNRRRRG
jgi:hypothetical protein